MKRIIFGALLLSLAQVVLGQLNEQKQEIYLNHMAILVSDLQKSTKFYEEVLHLKQIPEPFKDGLHTWFGLGQAGQLHLIQAAEMVEVRNKHDHMCFSVRSIDEFVARLNQHHVAYMNWAGTPQTITNRVDGVKQVFFRDPDGHYIEVNDDFPE